MPSMMRSATITPRPVISNSTIVSLRCEGLQATRSRIWRCRGRHGAALCYGRGVRKGDPMHGTRMHPELAIGCINGITRTAVEIERWKQVSETRWEIVPHSSAEGTPVLNALTFKNVSAIVDHCKGFWQRGNFLVVSIDDNTDITVLRGSPNRTISLPPNAS